MGFLAFGRCFFSFGCKVGLDEQLLVSSLTTGWLPFGLAAAGIDAAAAGVGTAFLGVKS